MTQQKTNPKPSIEGSSTPTLSDADKAANLAQFDAPESKDDTKPLIPPEIVALFTSTPDKMAGEEIKMGKFKKFYHDKEPRDAIFTLLFNQHTNSYELMILIRGEGQSPIQISRDNHSDFKFCCTLEHMKANPESKEIYVITPKDYLFNDLRS